VLLCLKTETELASKTSFISEKLVDGQSPENIFSVNVLQVPFSLLDFLTL